MRSLRPNFRPVHIALATLTLAALTLSACAPSPTPAPPQDINSTAKGSTLATTTTTTPAPAGIAALGKASMAQKTQRPSVPAELVPVTMRTGAHEGFDRVVIELKGTGTPGWFVDYTDQPAQQGSGKPVEIAGDSTLDVNIDGVVLPFELGLDTPPLAPITGQGAKVVQLKSVGTFEGRAQFVVGIKGQKTPYSVELLDNPTRVVIDIRH
ncbi:MAG: hypothetical protein Q4A31_11940 [Corynebacterium sp.]|uniref:AMIN-like domain-containing (lipo)protein n=1 Tax=Corynebacterium sp. TaxID=1720 RepID=UPI0026DC625D|nr:hypothetical protein [Corynebacterium sp.]MDO4762624.1 hypothetical protein [Corynebacterium sp.]